MAFSLPGCYVTRLAWQHNNLYNARRPVTAVLSDPQTSAKLRSQLMEVQGILDFAHQEGLNTAGAYRYYTDTQQSAVSYLVQAASAERLEPVTWWFPFLGKVPYLGFYQRQERDAEAAKLAAQGYDVFTSSVAAFSSLGWFDDPLYSSMLQRSRLDLALLLFHELTHRTLWVSGQADFSEQLATFMEEQLTLTYLKALGRSDELARYARLQADNQRYQEWLQSLKLALETLYAKPFTDKTQLKLQKAKIFASFSGEKRPAFQEADFVGSKPWNNATFLAASLYNPDLKRFARSFHCTQAARLGNFLQALSALVDKQPEQPYAALDSLCRPQEAKKKRKTPEESLEITDGRS